MIILLTLIALFIWSIVLITLFGVNFEYKNKYLHVSIKTEKKK